MSVYVDDMRADFGRMKMCHMIADSTEELLAMASRLGVRHQWIQQRGKYGEHFDIALSKRRLAVAAGAIEVSERELVLRTWLRHPDAEHRLRARAELTPSSSRGAEQLALL